MVRSPLSSFQAQELFRRHLEAYCSAHLICAPEFSLGVLIPFLNDRNVPAQVSQNLEQTPRRPVLVRLLASVSASALVLLVLVLVGKAYKSMVLARSFHY